MPNKSKEEELREERTCTKCGITKLLVEFEEYKKYRRGVCRTCRGVKDKGSYQRNRAKRLAQSRARSKNPIDRVKMSARHAVTNAIQKKTIKRLPCEKCGEKNAQAHHTDYSKPLLITWLCKKHHYEQHRKLGNRV